MLIDPATPVYNTIIIYILIMCIIILVKPKIMYCRKTNRFKSFGLGPRCTLISFPIVSISTAIGVYSIFLIIELLHRVLMKNSEQLTSKN